MGKLLFRLFTFFIILVLLACTAFIAFIYFTQYKPIDQSPITIRNPQTAQIIPNQNYSITTFNMGYGSHYSSNYIDSKNNRLALQPTISTLESHLKSMINNLLALDSDFYTLQEIDTDAKRSHHMNQNELISQSFKNYSASLAYTYNSPYIPLPLSNPIGQLESGLLTLSKFKTEQEQRLNLPRSEHIINQFVEPHYTLLETTIPVRGNSFLVIANLQLAPSDLEHKLISEQQFVYLSDYIKGHLSQDHYLILSGDWNHFIVSPTFKTTESWPLDLQNIPNTFKPSTMNWAIDYTHPTTRSMHYAYEPNMSFVSITDGFLVSDNIDISSVVTSPVGFNFSNHQPVTLTFTLK